MAIAKMGQMRAVGLTAAAALSMLLSSCGTCDVLNHGAHNDCETARVCEKPAVRALAHDLDALEAHIERYGSVVIQHPSVWGQARLTKHRQDYENQMVTELGNFTATLNGSISRSDQAYFVNALSLSAAISAKSSSGGSSSSSSSSAAPTNPADAGIPSDVFGGFTGMTRSPATLPALTGFSSLSKNGITLEPTTYLNQKDRYLKHLNELRRINEGDDTGDAAGYALNLVRIPVSVLPGKCTDRGYGAEVTMTLRPYLSDELLPTTFRNLVVNDLLEVIGVPLTQCLNDKNSILILNATKVVWDVKKVEGESPVQPKVQENKKDGTPALPSEMSIGGGKRRAMASSLDIQTFLKSPAKPLPSIDTFKKAASSAGIDVSSPQSFANSAEANSQTDIQPLRPTFGASKLRHAKRPFPQSQTIEIFGKGEYLNLAVTAHDTFSVDPANKYWVHYPDVQNYLQDELQAAYRFLADPTHMALWEYCSQELVTAIHTRNLSKIFTIRNRFGDHVAAMTKRYIEEDVTVTLAWAIIVDSALLNDQLVQDMKEAAAAKNFPAPHNDWLPYYLPVPPHEARMAFNRYVECRWPIIAFAVDPVTEQQNISDTYLQRQEMQLALSLAFVNGKISANNMTRYARRLETQMEVIQLNNTMAGFSHGNETFGWRFYPRVQTPEIESNTTVLFRDLLIGDQRRDVQLRQRKIEPGQRECTAIVIMPSFVPYCTMDVSSSWFSLTNPKCKDMTCVDAVKLSARVKAIDNCADRVQDAHCYREGELERLKKKAKQLEDRLPLQNTMVQIPYENTLGGFAMFNTGVTDLAPELYGWYGAPGINTNDTTTIFLIGNHFSVQGTRVIVGGVAIDPTTGVEMLSRQVMKITVPKGALMMDQQTGTFAIDPVKPTPKTTVNTIDLTAKAGIGAVTAEAEVKGNVSVTTPAADAPPPQQLFVDIHVATPYGVTSHLLVPALGKVGTQAGVAGQPALSVANWAPNAISVGFSPKGLGIGASVPPTVRPSDLTIQFATQVSTANNADLVLTIAGGGSSVKYDFTLPGVAISKQITLTITSAQRDALIAAVFDKIGPQLTKDIAQANPATVTIKSIVLKQDTAILSTITPSTVAPPPGGVLTVNFVAAVIAPTTPPSPPAPQVGQ